MKPIPLWSIVIGVIAIVVYRSFFWNSSPKPLPDVVSTEERPVIEIPVLKNDRDPDGDILHVSGIDDSIHATVIVSDDRQFIRYIPNSNFVGTDMFVYRVTDSNGAEAESTVTVDVTFAPPDFHQRHEVATLPEMLNEPPTSIYGSTIDVFLYQNGEGHLREITIAGHADSITCSDTSGAFASALLFSNAREGDFLLAGAGRMTVPEAVQGQLEMLQSDLDVQQFLDLSRLLSYLRFQIDNQEISIKEAEVELGMSLDEAQRELDELAKEETVAEYISSVRPLEAAEIFEGQAREIAEGSGLLRLHEVPYSVIEDVTERIRVAAQSAEESVIQFSDLLPAEDAEAVAYIPMMYLNSADPVVLRVPTGEFSPDGLADAAVRYRSELETAVIGSAEHRLRHATRLLDDSRHQYADCQSMTEEELNEIIHSSEWENCDRDTCVKEWTSLTMTYGEFCVESVPIHLETYAGWKQDAEEIISRIKLMQQEQDIDRIDALTYAALVDSMLRDWALPFPQAQAAFDHWLEEGRATAWKSITTAMYEAGIGRAALSGESLVFDVRQVGDTMEIRPLMVVDIQRSHVVIDPELSVTALVNPWELRKIATSAELSTAHATDIGALLLEDQAASAALVSSRPQAAASVFMDQQLTQLPADGADWERRREEALRGHAQLFTDVLSKSLNEAHTQKLASSDEARKHLAVLTLPMYLARHAEYMGASYRLHVAHSFLRTALIHEERSGDGAWDMIRNAYKSSEKSTLSNATAEYLLGDPFDIVLNDIFDLATVEDSDEIQRIIDQADPPKPPESAKTPVIYTRLTRIVDQAEEARSALALRSAIERAIAAYNVDGSVHIRDLQEALIQPNNTAPIYNADIWNDVSVSLRRYSLYARQGELGPIEGSEFLVILSAHKKLIDSRLLGLRPALSSYRFGHDQEAIVTRLLFDEGSYAEAFERLTPTRAAVAQYHPDLSWTPLATDLKGIPDRIMVRIENDGVIMSASIGEQSYDVLRLDGLGPDDRQALSETAPEPILPWTEGDPLWEQILIAEVPARPAAREVATAAHSDTSYLAMLKAIVYTCAVPGAQILEEGGRCAPVNGSTQLYDRVQDSEAASFIVPDLSEMNTHAQERFDRPRAWQFESTPLE